jgi:hypothetical protein
MNLTEKEFFNILDRILLFPSSGEVFERGYHSFFVIDLEKFDDDDENIPKSEQVNVDYNKIGINNIHIFEHYKTRYEEILTFSFEYNSEYYLVESNQEEDSYYSNAIKAKSYTSLNEKAKNLYYSENNDYINLEDDLEYLKPFIEKEMLENKIKKMRVDVNTHENKLKI